MVWGEHHKMNPTLARLFVNSRFYNLDDLEADIAAMPGAHCWLADSPLRFEILREGVERGKGGPDARLLPILIPAIRGIIRSLKSVSDNPAPAKTEASGELLAELEAFLKELGITSVGYTRLPQRWIFRNKAILLVMEMDKPRIDTAPSREAMRAVWETYRDQGWIANEGADWLRQRGYSAQAGHPLMGQALYPPLAQSAGLGWLGANGLIITPEHGPRVRLAAIFTSIENLPFSTANNHEWVADYCTTCQVCVAQCPPEAIRTVPARHENGQVTYVSNERCFPYFSDYYGCSVCIRVCPFNHTNYAKLQKTHKVAITR